MSKGEWNESEHECVYVSEGECMYVSEGEWASVNRSLSVCAKMSA